MPDIYEIYGEDAFGMTTRLLQEAGAAAKIPQGASIGLKPNLVVATPAAACATTHTEIVAAIIEYMEAHGHRELAILEGSGVGVGDTAVAFRRCGYEALAKKYAIPLYDLKRDSAIAVDTAIGKIKICERALNTDYLINLPVLKGHCQTVLTAALKNCKGCIPDSEKRRFHTIGLHKPIAALAAALRPGLTIVDSMCGDLNFEEGGTPVHTNRMLLGEDMVQLDAYACTLMGIDEADVPYIRLAEQYGAGSRAIPPGSVAALGSPSQGKPSQGKPSQGEPNQGKPNQGKPGGTVKRLTAEVREDSACSACYGSLVHALYRHKRAGEPYPVYIGQGYRGQTLDGVGIGNCCRGADICALGCPPPAGEILRVLKQYEKETTGSIRN